MVPVRWARRCRRCSWGWGVQPLRLLQVIPPRVPCSTLAYSNAGVGITSANLALETLRCVDLPPTRWVIFSHRWIWASGVWRLMSPLADTIAVPCSITDSSSVGLESHWAAGVGRHGQPRRPSRPDGRCPAFGRSWNGPYRTADRFELRLLLCASRYWTGEMLGRQ